MVDIKEGIHKHSCNQITDSKVIILYKKTISFLLFKYTKLDLKYGRRYRKLSINVDENQRNLCSYYRIYTTKIRILRNNEKGF
jgi:hypothetical protein